MFGISKKVLEDATLELARGLDRTNARINSLEQEIQLLKTNMNSLRGLINRKLNPEKPAEVIEEPVSETSKNPEIFLSPNGAALKHK